MPAIRNRSLLAACLTSAALAALSVATVHAGTPPPPATFTPNARADAAETGAGQNEPQVAVDQTGRAYVDWQSSTNANGSSAAASTTDGVTFNYLGVPDPKDTGTAIDGDVDMATTSWPALTDTAAANNGDNGIFFGHLKDTTCGAIGIRDAPSTNAGATWAPMDASCAPSQVDRPWIAAYTPPLFRGTPGAASHTEVFNEYHDFASSQIFVTRSFNGGASWDPVQYLAINQTSAENATTFCNSIPSGIAVDQRGAHPGRVYVLWETSDVPNNLGGCDETQAQPFDHVFLSWSDDIGNSSVTLPTWNSTAVFNDPCAPSPPTPPTSPSSCQDVSELFNSLAVDDAGNVFAAFIYRDIVHEANPEYDVYTAESTDGGNTFSAPRKVNTDTGTHYMPWIAAGQSGAIDITFYRTSEIEGTGLVQKPQGASANAVWDVYLAQSFDGGLTFTQNKVSDANDATGGSYFGDICTTGIFCSATPPGSGWGSDRILFDDFGVAIGPDGGARVIWTDARASHTGACLPGGTVSCQTTHVMFACQTGGEGLHGETITGCGTVLGSNIPDARWVPGLPLLGVAALFGGRMLRTRRRRGSGARGRGARGAAEVR